MTDQQFTERRAVERAAWLDVLRNPLVAEAQKHWREASHHLIQGLTERTFMPVQFEREPDEHLLDGSDTSMRAQLDEAGFGSGGVL